MYFDGVYALRGKRRIGGKSPHKHNCVTTFACKPLLAALTVCAAIGAAHANPGAAAATLPPAHAAEPPLSLVHTTAESSAAQKFAALLDVRFDSPVLNLHVGALAGDDITGSISDLRFDPAPPKLTRLASLTPPAAVDVTGYQSDGLAAEMIVGIASMYNPIDPTDKDAGGLETASGELYDAAGWTAAIRLDLRGRFGGVRYGRNYRSAYALVEAGDKRVIVKINDVGPLRPGRIIDLNERTMHFFDPSLQLGLINGIRVTPLAGTDWVTGPVGGGGETVTIAGGNDLEPRYRPQTSSAISTIIRSLAHCSSSASVLPSSVEAKPHCGDRPS
jgi:rare lipoprotein A